MRLKTLLPTRVLRRFAGLVIATVSLFIWLNLSQRVDVAPYRTPEMAFGETASVMAMSWGKGDPQRDDINIVYLDEGGRLREQTKIDNLYDQAMRDEFFDLIKRRRPDVIVVGGFTIATAKLSARLKELLRAGPNPDPNNLGAPPDPDFQIPVIYVRDEVARIFQHSPRAVEEFGPIPEVAKYCIGMARFVQNPLNEYAALGADISAISFDKDDQHLVRTWYKFSGYNSLYLKSGSA